MMWIEQFGNRCDPPPAEPKRWCSWCLYFCLPRPRYPRLCLCPLTSPVAYVGSCGGTRRGACDLKPRNERLKYNHELFRTTSRTGGHGGAIAAPTSWPDNGAVADSAHATDDIKKTTRLRRSGPRRAGSGGGAGEVAQHSTRRSRRRYRLVSRLARTRRSNGRKSRGSPANMGGRQATKTPLIPSKRP